MAKVYFPCAVLGPKPKLSVAVHTLLPALGAEIAKEMIFGVVTPGAQLVQ